MIATHVSSPIRSGEGERPHRVREAELGDGVDRLRLGDSGVERPDGLVDERHQDPVGDEPGEVVGLSRNLPELLGEGDDRAGRLVRGLAAADHLDELQDRHGIEEVHADDLVRPARDGSERADRDRRGVRGEDRLDRQRRVRPPEDVLLDGDVLDDGLDHQVGWDEVVDGLDATEHLVGIGSPLLRELGGAAADRLERPVGRPRRGVVKRDPAARGSRDLRDAAAHLAGADDEDMLELHAAAG